MDRVSNEMGIETNDANMDYHVPDVERNNRVIKERFKIAYYRLNYKKIPRIIICHLSMNVTQNLNPFPAKGGVSDHYIPNMILSQRNWDYNKIFQVESSDYVKASQVNDPNNTNCTRILDGIYLCPAPNFQGGHQIMDLWTRQLITGQKLIDMHIRDVVINSVEKWRRRRDLIY